MREILFKAKKIDTGEWVEGYLGKFDNSDGTTDLTIIPSNEVCENGFSWYSIDENTICRFAGLNDKNGNKIWENDVLRGHGDPDDLVKVVLGQFYIIDVETLEKVESVIGWHTEVIETDVISTVEPFCLPMPLTQYYIDRSKFEVIGNIFDNPELIS